MVPPQLPRRAVTARAVAVSAGLHLVIVIALVAAGAAARPPRTVDVEIVAPTLLVTQREPTQPIEQAADPAPGGRRLAAAPPVRRAEPQHKLPRPHRRPAPPPAEPTSTPAGELATGTQAAEPAPSTDGSAAQVEGGAGGGWGTGIGAGNGDVDLSARPVPLELHPSQTLPYTEAALRDQISGDVSLELIVDPLGRVERAVVRRGLG